MKELQEKNENIRERFRVFYEERYRHLNEIISEHAFALRPQNPMLADAFGRFRTLNGKGKRYRGILAYIGCLLAGNSNLGEADALAEAYEIFQTAVLIHDDIADRGDMRRGMPTIHRQYSREFLRQLEDCTPQDAAELSHTAASVALCIGDIGFYLGEQKLVKAYSGKPYFGALLDCYHRALIRTLSGELLDIELPCLERYGLSYGNVENAGETQESVTPKLQRMMQKNEIVSGQKNDEAVSCRTVDFVDRREESEIRQTADGYGEGGTPQKADLESLITDIHELKTSSYTVTGPLCAGMLLGNASPETVSRMERIGNMVGRAFQIKDDLDGIFAGSGAIGKDAASDIREFKTTLLYAYVKKAGGRPWEELLKYYGKQELSEADVRAVQAIFLDTGAEAYSREIMDGLFSRSRRELKELSGVTEEGKLLFGGFIAFLEQKETI